MNKFVRRLVPPTIRNRIHLYRSLPSRVAALESRFAPASGAAGRASSVLNQHEKKVFSQNGEDGILEYIFQRVGTTNRTFVEFGVEDGRECNTANLSLNYGWNGLLMDADEASVESAQKHYAETLGEDARRVRIVPARVTPENINSLLTANGITGVIDLLSIDIDSNDLWVWQSITVIQPRVVVIEYNASFGSARSLATAYDPDFDRFQKHPSGIYHGASLMALARVGRRRGYLLAGCESAGVNAFFVWEAAVAGTGVGEVTTDEAFFPIRLRSYTLDVEEQFDTIRELELIEV